MIVFPNGAVVVFVSPVVAPRVLRNVRRDQRCLHGVDFVRTRARGPVPAHDQRVGQPVLQPRRRQV